MDPVLPSETEPTFKPLGFADVFERAFRIVGRNWKTYAIIILLLLVPPNIAILGSFFTLPPDFLMQEQNDVFAQAQQVPPVSPAELTMFFILLIVGIVIAVPFGAAATGATYATAIAGHADQKPDWRTVVGMGFRKMPSLLWVFFLQGMALLGILTFVIAPGVVSLVINVDWTSVLLTIALVLIALTIVSWLWLVWLFAPATVIVESERGVAALRRSYGLVKGRFWWIGAVTVVVFFGASFVSGIFTFPVALISLTVFRDNFVLSQGLQMAANLVGVALTFPVQMTVVTLLYADTRVVNEGLTPLALTEEVQSAFL